MNRLLDKVMLITGGGSGLGRQVAILAAQEGAKVVVTDKEEDRIGPVVQAITDTGGTACGVRADVCQEDEVAAAVELAVETYGRLDVAHANAGVTVPGQGSISLEDVTIDQWNAVNDTNLLGVFLTLKHAVRAMKSSSGGSIVVTSSAASLVAYPGFGAYVAGKAGVNGLVRAAAFEFGRYGIRVNATCPTHGMSVNFGLEPSAEVVGLSYEQAAGNWDPEAAVIPLRLPFPPGLEHNAWPIIFLASDESQYMSGVSFPTCDGGQHARTSIPFPDNWVLSAESEKSIQTKI
ncbi:SDR family NAD(P)-dependent oxidoreductase [Rhodococcus rhodochrous]|uniref:SDR family NAD(P)-dependent oxidoreductase n=1 Tax=Rhodococcus rhodochrous TaxID=1829 RepID=UPI0009BCAAEE|nr:SDR family NAD(P)-dependent oxidoreductase [Rhodococcus rhodochrous]